MARRSKVLRRALLLLLIAALLLGGLASAYAFRKWQRNREALQQRAIGIKAFETGDYKTALVSLNTYLKRYQEDVDALEKLARARLELVEPRGQHIGPAMTILRRILYLDPEHPYARGKLLELYTLAGMNTECIQLADETLQRNPQDTAALRAKAIALARLLRFDEALPCLEAYVKEKPLDFEMQSLLFDVSFRVNESAGPLIKKAEALRSEHPGDPRWELLQAYAYRYARDRKNVLHWLRQASSQPPPDDTFVAALVELLDQVGLHGQALEVLEKAAEKGDNLALQQEVVQRLWERGRHEEVVNRFTRLAADLDQASPELLSLAARSYYTLGRPEDAKKLVDALARRKEQPRAVAWAEVFRALHGEKQGTPLDVVTRCKQALQQDPRNAFFEAILGTSYHRLGEVDLAFEHWRRAAELRPLWATPHLRLARLALATDRPREALLHAQRAAALMPDRIEPAVLWALARAANLPTSPGDSRESLLQFVQRLQKAADGEQRLLPLEVSLLADTGRKEQAAQRLADALKREPPVDEKILRALARLSQQYAPALAKEYQARIASLYGTSPDRVLAEALRRAGDQSPDEAVAWFDDQARAARAKDPLAWRLARARLLDATHSPQAREAWKDLLQEQRDNLRVLRAGLQTRSVQADRELARQTIDRLRELVGPEGTAWRVEQARWLLQSDAEDDAAQAIAILEKLLAETPSSIEARLLLAQGLQRMGQMQRAIRELTQVADARPDSIPIALELARYLQMQGQFDKARHLFDRVLENPRLSRDDRVRVARMLTNQADPQDDARAIAILESLKSKGPIRAHDPRLLLAQLYIRQGDEEKAKAMCRQLLATPSLQSVRFALAYYTEQGDDRGVADALKALGTLELPAGTAEIVRGDHLRQKGDDPGALEAYRKAAAQAPENTEAWQRLVAQYVRHGLADEALHAAAEAQGSARDAQRFAFFLSQQEHVRTFASSDGMRDFVLALLADDPRHRQAAARVLEVGAEALAKNLSTAETAARLRPLAEKYPRFLPLQIFVGRAYLAVNQLDDAIDIALRAMRNLPRSAEPAWLAAEALGRAGRWDESIVVARQWRHRQRGNPLDADLMIAEAEIRLGKARLAADKMEPYLKEALAQGGKYSQVIERYARALIADGKPDEAAGVLRDRLPKSAAWRGLWMQLAAMAIKDPQVASRWLRTVETHVPADADGERAGLAQSWYLLATRTGEEAYAKEAERLAAPLASGAHALPGMNLMLALIAGNRGDLQTAVKYYRAELKIDATNHVAMNNLAMALAERDGNLDEALALARRATELLPKRANYFDTLAQVYVKRGDFDRAIHSIEKAIALEPGEPKWEVRLRDIQAAAKR